MPIVNYIDLFVSSLLSILLTIYCIKTLFNDDIDNNKFKVIISILMGTFFIELVNIFNKDTFKVLFTLPFVFITIKNVFSINYNKTILYVVFATLYMFVAELILGILFSILPIDYTFIFNNFFGTTAGTIITALITIVLLLNKKVIMKVRKIVHNIEGSDNIFTSILIILLMGTFLYKLSIGLSDVSIINTILTCIIALIFIIIIYMYYKENQTVKEISDNYNDLFKYLEKYEKELVEKRKIIHDYKNQLIVINGYIGDDVKLKEYVNELIKEQKLVNENSIINNIDKLPKGLKGLVYYKLSHIDQNIVISLNVRSTLKKFNDLNSKLSKDILKIIGILIDNAIEALNLEKDKYINIEFYVKNNKFFMNLSNPCTKDIDLSKIMENGYSTKGRNRGYGMSLVKDILNKYENVSLNLKNEDNEFISELVIEIKK